MDGSWKVPGAAPRLFVAGGAPLLHGDVQMFEAMLAGWADQQASRNLHGDTITGRVKDVRRFQRFTNDWPWNWRPADLEEFSSELRSAGRALSTLRTYQSSVRMFCDYICPWP